MYGPGSAYSHNGQLHHREANIQRVVVPRRHHQCFRERCIVSGAGTNAYAQRRVLGVASRVAHHCLSAAQTFGPATSVNHTDMVEPGFPGPVPHVVPQERPNQHAEKGSANGRAYCVFRTLHLATQAVQAIPAPQRMPELVLLNVLRWADVHAKAASGAPIGIHREQPAIDLLNQPSACHAPFDAIHERWLGFVLRLRKLPFGGAPSDGETERSGSLKFDRRWMVGGEQITFPQMPQEVRLTVAVKIADVLGPSLRECMSQRIYGVEGMSAVNQEAKYRHAFQARQHLQTVAHIEG